MSRKLSYSRLLQLDEEQDEDDMMLINAANGGIGHFGDRYRFRWYFVKVSLLLLEL